jgi:trimeric autotransporter adhesin
MAMRYILQCQIIYTVLCLVPQWQHQTFTGSLALLLQHYKNTHNNEVPLSSTLKAIVIHTADESGSDLGPDYKYGWGLLNTYKAAQLITTDQGTTTTIQELSLSQGQGQSYTLDGLYSEGTSPIKVTLVWNDIPPVNYQTGPILMHDLDVRLYKAGNPTPFYPWKLNPASPNSPATKEDNSKDNVEQILLQSPGEGYYSVVVSHKGNLAFNQMFSLVVTDL